MKRSELSLYTVPRTWACGTGRTLEKLIRPFAIANATRDTKPFHAWHI